MPNEVTEKEAQLMDIDQPRFLTLTKNPANRTGFKIIRSHDPSVLEDAPKKVRVRKKQRADHPGLRAIMLPQNLTDEQLAEVVDRFKLGDAYRVDDHMGSPILVRNGVDFANDCIDNGKAVPFGHYTAYLDPENLVMRTEDATEEKVSGVTLIRIEFDEQTGDQEAIEKWLADKEIDICSSDNFEPLLDGGAILTRFTPEAEVPVKKVRLDDGVYGYVAPSEKDNIPSSVYRNVVEAAYGNWGWGSVDFVQAISDVQFSDMASQALYILRDVLDHILFYSEQGLDERKTLVQNATNSFTAYIIGLLDSLPRDAVQRSDKPFTSPETTNMSDPKTDQGASEKVEGQTASPENKGEFVTRAELKDAVTEAVTEAVPAAMAAFQAKKGDEAGGEGESGAAQRSDNSDDSSVAEAITAMAESIKGLKENISGVSRSVTELKTEVDELSGETTVTRSDDNGADETPEEDANDEKSKSVFRGCFGKVA